MITVRITGLVIPSANNIVDYDFLILSRLYKGVYIFQQDITPNKVHVCVYIEGIIFEQPESPIRNKQYILKLLIF